MPWRRVWQFTPVFLLGESHGPRSLPGYKPWGHKELDTTEGLIHTHKGHYQNEKIFQVYKIEAAGELIINRLSRAFDQIQSENKLDYLQMKAIDGRSHRCGLPPQRQVHWPPLPKLAEVPDVALAMTAVYDPRVGNAG